MWGTEECLFHEWLYNSRPCGVIERKSGEICLVPACNLKFTDTREYFGAPVRNEEPHEKVSVGIDWFSGCDKFVVFTDGRKEQIHYFKRTPTAYGEMFEFSTESGNYVFGANLLPRKFYKIRYVPDVIDRRYDIDLVPVTDIESVTFEVKKEEE